MKKLNRNNKLLVIFVLSTLVLYIAGLSTIFDIVVYTCFMLIFKYLMSSKLVDIYKDSLHEYKRLSSLDNYTIFQKNQSNNECKSLKILGKVFGVQIIFFILTLGCGHYLMNYSSLSYYLSDMELFVIIMLMSVYIITFLPAIISVCDNVPYFGIFVIYIVLLQFFFKYLMYASDSVPNFTHLLVFVFLTALIFLPLSFLLKTSVLNKLSKSNTVVQLLLVILAYYMSDVVYDFMSNLREMNSEMLTLESIMEDSSISDSLHGLLKENSILLNTYNEWQTTINFINQKEATNLTMVYFDYLVVSFGVSMLILNVKINSNNKKADKIYKKIMLNNENNMYDYFEIKECVFYGGDNYLNLLLANIEIKKVITENEKLNIKSYLNNKV